MDLSLYARVVWRQRLLFVTAGALAIVLAVLSYASVSVSNGRVRLTPRGSETWQAQSTLLITQDGFPYGRAVPKYQSAPESSRAPAVQLGDQTRFANLSQVYSELANSDVVHALLRSSEPVAGTVTAQAAVDPNGVALPLLNISAQGPTQASASRLAAGASAAFRDYVAKRQQDAGISAEDRVQLQVLNSGHQAMLLAPRKKTLPMLVFFAVMAAAFGLALICERSRGGAGPLARAAQAEVAAVTVEALSPVRGVAASPAEPSQRLA